MCDPTSIALTMGALAAASTFTNSRQQAKEQKYQADLARYEADVAANNALAARQRADVERQQGRIAQEEVDRERSSLRGKYEAEAGAARSLMAAGNVELSSGSAADSLMGSAYLFAEDMAANRYRHQLTGWEAEEKARQTEYQASMYDTQSESSRNKESWLKKSATNLGGSLLSAGVAGVGAGLSGYAMGGGRIAGSTSALMGLGSRISASARLV